jgi:glycine/D-amino acid oxidase-like deaminating enzyme
MGLTPDGYPHVGRVPGIKNAWMLAVFNGEGIPLIAAAAEAVAKMAREDVRFSDVKEEFALLGCFGTSSERLVKGDDKENEALKMR